MTSYHKNWEEALKNPDIVGDSKGHEGCRIYLLENNKERKFPAKFLVVVVNQMNFIVSIRFGRNDNCLNNKKIMKDE